MGGEGSGSKAGSGFKGKRHYKKSADGKFETMDARLSRFDIEGGFKFIQRKALDELKQRTTKSKLKEMDLENIGKVLRTCRENLAAIHQRKLSGVDEKEIEFVMQVPVEKEKG